MNKLILWTCTAAMAGLLFGFDTAVISGADQLIQHHWHLSDLEQGGLIMSSAIWGTVIGAFFGFWPTDHWGRKKTLIIIGWVFLLSSVGSALAPSPYIFAFMRILGGFAIGASSVATPAYISEISPSEKRGTLVTTFQLNIGLGILLAFVSNYLVGTMIHENYAWRVMLFINAVPAAAFLFLLLFVPESPRWLLLHKNDKSQALKILHIINPDNNPEALVQDIIASNERIKRSAQKSSFSNYIWPVTLVIVIAFFNQFSGVNFVVFYAPRILASAGLGANSALLASVSVGLAMFLFTGVGMFLIDRIGRKKLLILGSLGYIVSLLLLAFAFLTNETNPLLMAFYLFLFISSHGVGQGAIIWVFMAEIFPDHYRARGQSIGTATHWISAAIITFIMPWALHEFGGGIVFLFFAGLMGLQLLFACFIMPETKGLSLEDIQNKLVNKQENQAYETL